MRLLRLAHNPRQAECLITDDVSLSLWRWWTYWSGPPYWCCHKHLVGVVWFGCVFLREFSEKFGSLPCVLCGCLDKSVPRAPGNRVHSFPIDLDPTRNRSGDPQTKWDIRWSHKNDLVIIYSLMKNQNSQVITILVTLASSKTIISWARVICLVCWTCRISPGNFWISNTVRQRAPAKFYQISSKEPKMSDEIVWMLQAQ